MVGQRCAVGTALPRPRHGQSAPPAADRSAQRLQPRRRWAAPAACGAAWQPGHAGLAPANTGQVAALPRGIRRFVSHLPSCLPGVLPAPSRPRRPSSPPALRWGHFPCSRSTLLRFARFLNIARYRAGALACQGPAPSGRALARSLDTRSGRGGLRRERNALHKPKRVSRSQRHGKSVERQRPERDTASG